VHRLKGRENLFYRRSDALASKFQSRPAIPGTLDFCGAPRNFCHSFVFRALFVFGSATRVERKSVFLRIVKPALGLGLCSAAALLVTAVSATHAWRVFVPFAFIAVIVLLAARYGMWVAVLGSVMAALIFAYFIFPPLHSLRVEDKMERSAIAWMILGGVAVPFLFATKHRPRQR
jgi:hypothetical protein